MGEGEGEGYGEGEKEKEKKKVKWKEKEKEREKEKEMENMKEKEKVRQEVTPSMRANLIRIIGRYHSHVLPARGGADAPTIACTASTAAASTDAAAD